MLHVNKTARGLVYTSWSSIVRGSRSLWFLSPFSALVFPLCKLFGNGKNIITCEGFCYGFAWHLHAYYPLACGMSHKPIPNAFACNNLLMINMPKLYTWAPKAHLTTEEAVQWLFLLRSRWCCARSLWPRRLQLWRNKWRQHGKM